MINLRDLQESIARTLYDSVEFTDLCTSLVGSKLNFFKDSSVERFDEELPYLVVHKFNKTSQEDMDDHWIMQFLVGIEADEKYVDDNGIKYYPSTNTVEEIVDKAIELLNYEFQCFGVNADRNLRIFGYNVLITEIGEGEDIQAIVTLNITSYSFL